VASQSTLLSTQDLSVVFDTPYGSVQAIDHVNLTVGENEIVCLVGESGCGKSTLGLSLIGLLPMPPARIVSGKIIHKGINITSLRKNDLRLMRGTEFFMIFQEPMSSLNPVLTIENQLLEALKVRNERVNNNVETAVPKSKLRDELVRSLETVKVPDPERVLNGYPHQLSGGMRQRVMIAMALLLKPTLLIADEPTTALDVSTQDQILKLFKDLVGEELKGSVVFITHDLTLVKTFAERVAVMYAGEIVEDGPVELVLKDPKHPYTQGLLKCLPKNHKKDGSIESIPGAVPDLTDPPPGCKFNPRCKYVMDKCSRAKPQFFSTGKEHSARCFLYE
jgi:peptide/nickel transport system ATP-binding protein